MRLHTSVPLTLALSLVLAATSGAEEVTAYVERISDGPGKTSSVVLHLDPVKARIGKLARLTDALSVKARRLKGQARRFTVTNDAGKRQLEGAAGRRVRVEAELDRKAGTAVVQGVLSPREVTFTGVLVDGVAYTQGGKAQRSQGLSVDGKAIAAPGLHYFGYSDRVLGQRVTVRGTLYDLDNVLYAREVAATLTEESTLTRLATEYGGGVEGSPMVNTDHTLPAGAALWVSAAHAYHMGDWVEVRDAQGRSGLTFPELLVPRVDPSVKLTPAVPPPSPAAPTTTGVSEALKQAH
ncbi:MAG: hypothetical protein KDD82_15065 [Planctomycetes bacterium]|nr:hypothetical protein [Planctomycetota bacterium]